MLISSIILNIFIGELLFLIYALYDYRFNLHKRFSDKIFILNLAFADLMYCGIDLSLNAYQYFYPKWEWGIFSCQIISNIRFSNPFAEWMSLALVAASRCYSIIRPEKSKVFFSKCNLILIVIFNRIYGFALLIPFNFGVMLTFQF